MDSVAPEHGGRLREAARRWDIPLDAWIDLSTGINPHPWPLPSVPDAVWHRLPEDDDGLEQAARAALGLPVDAGCLPVPGSQAAIQCLPRLRPPGRVAVPAPGYAEHGHWWARAGHQVQALSPDEMDTRLDTFDVVVWIQPCNPTGQALPVEQLLRWHASLARRSGWLVVDEAFVEPDPVWSVAPALGRPGLIVLRSLGKFFGLAGARAGLVLGANAFCRQLRQDLGPWAVPGPTRWLMARALADTAWQEHMRKRLAVDSRRLDQLLHDAGLPAAGGTALFRYCPHPDAASLRDRLAATGILVRHFETPAALRFGLPGNEEAWQRLETTLCRILL